MLKQFHNSANNTLSSHYKAPCYDFISVQARALWLLAALNPGTVCVASACSLNARGEGNWLYHWAKLCSPRDLLFLSPVLPPGFRGCDEGMTHLMISVWEGNRKGPCVFKFLWFHTVCLAIDLCPKPAELNLPRMTTVYSGFSYITAVAAFHIALIQTQW